MFKTDKGKTIGEIISDAGMILIGLAFAVRMFNAVFKNSDITLTLLMQTIAKMPSDLWNSGDDMFCAVVLLITGFGLAMSGWAFLTSFMEQKGIKWRDVLKWDMQR